MGAPAGGGSQAKTIMGYAAADLIKEMKEKGAGGVAVPGPSPTPASGSGPAASPPPAEPPPAAAPAEPPPAAAPMGPPPGAAPMGPPPGAAPMGPPPGAAPMGPPPGAAPMGPPPGAAPMGPPPGAAPMGPPGGAPPPMGGQPGMPYGAPGSAPMPMPGQAPVPQRPSTEQVRPLQAPPYLASETAARMDAPVDPWEGTLKMVMVLFGIILVAAFAAPWAIGGDKTIFSWTALKGAPTFAKVTTIMLVGTGALSIIMGVLPLASIGRGVIAALLGLTPIVYSLVGSGGDFKWKPLVLAIGTLGIVGGLLVRSQYRAAMAGRILVTIGVICVLLYFLVPQGGGSPPLVGLFKALGNVPGKGKVAVLLSLLPFFLAVISLIVWIPSSSSAAGTPLAWAWIVLPLVTSIVALLIAGNIGPTLKAGLYPVIWLPAAQMAWIALVGYGVAVVVGKNLEHS